MTKFKCVWLTCVIVAFFTGCASMCGRARDAMTPEDVVEMYLDISLNMTKVEQKQELLKLTTGNLKNALESASDDIVNQAFIKQGFKLQKYSVVERRDRTPRETEITFQLTYKNLGPDRAIKIADAPQTTTENTVSVVRSDGAWYIRDVLGKKTTIDFILEEEIKPDPMGSSDEYTDPNALPPSPTPEEENQEALPEKTKTP